MKQLILIFVIGFFVIACEKSSSSPSTSSVPECEKNHTATVTWQNTKATTYNMTIGGATKAIGASQTVTFTGVAVAVTQGTCVQGGTTTIVSFPAALKECNTSAFAF